MWSQAQILSNDMIAESQDPGTQVLIVAANVLKLILAYAKTYGYILA